MCAAFAAEGMDVVLHARRGKKGAVDTQHYGVPPSFEVRFSWHPNRIRGRQWAYAALVGAKARLGGAGFAYARCVYSARVAASLGLPVFFEAHAAPALDSKQHRGGMARLFGKATLLGVVSVTHALNDELIRRYRVPREATFVAPNGADPVAAVELLTLRKPGRLCVGYVGQLYAGKGMEIIVPLARRCAWADFHIVGGPADLVERWRRELGDVPNVFFHGFVAPVRTARYIASFDAVLVPCLRRVSGSGGEDIAPWTSPLKLFEYLAHGRAIVASDLPVLREVLKHQENCLLCPPEAPAKWEETLGQLQLNPALGEEIGRRAREEFLANYTWRQRARQVLGFMQARLARLG